MGLLKPGVIVPDKEQVQKALAPYQPTFRKCFQDAWQLWLSRLENDPEFFYLLSPRTRASAISDHATSQIAIEFAGKPGVTITYSYKYLLLNINNDLLLRFKKVNNGLLASNIPTNQQLKFELQLPLPGFEWPMPRLTVGYKLDANQTSIDDVCVTFTYDGKLIWAYSIIGGEDVSDTGTIIPFPSSPVKPPVITASGSKKQEAAGSAE